MRYRLAVFPVPLLASQPTKLGDILLQVILIDYLYFNSTEKYNMIVLNVLFKKHKSKARQAQITQN
jgi:hypothetical protein